MTFIATSVLGGVLAVLCDLRSVAAARCLECTDIANPFGCNTAVDCATGEWCFIQQSVTLKGLITYSMGCLPSQRCHNKKRGAGDIVTCLNCCHGDYCNRDGCGTVDCKDVLSCSARETRALFCSDDTWAVQFCKRTCGKCDKQSTPIRFSQCGDPVSTARCSLLDGELCLCHDPILRQMCLHYCNGQCYDKPVNTSQCGSVTPLIGKRSEILRQLSDPFY